MRTRLLVVSLMLLCVSCGPADETSTTTIVLARHGQTEANLTNTLAGKRINSELTDKGKEQAAYLGKRLSGKRFDAFYCSSLIRTESTGAIALENIQDHPKLDPIITKDLDDVDYGEATGMTETEAAQTYGNISFPTAFGPVDDADFEPTFTEENTYRWYQRFNGALEKIAKTHTGKTVFVVSHGAALYWGQLKFGTEKVTGFANAAYAEIQFKDNDWSLFHWENVIPESKTKERHKWLSQIA